jgi:hypothetical protein
LIGNDDRHTGRSELPSLPRLSIEGASRSIGPIVRSKKKPFHVKRPTTVIEPPRRGIVEKRELTNVASTLFERSKRRSRALPGSSAPTAISRF